MYPIFIRIGDFAIRWYGVMIALSVIIGIIYSYREFKKIGINDDTFYDYVIWLIIFGVLGARLFYILFNTPLYYFKNPLRIFYLWEGGLSYLGIVVIGYIFSYYYWKKRGNLFYKVADIASIPLALGWGIGRIGCTLNGCCYGKPTGLPFPFSITFTNPESFAAIGISRYPTQPLLSILGFITFFVLLKLKGKIKIDGAIFSLFLVFYGASTFIVEFLRGDHFPIFGLTPAQWGVFPILIFAYLFYKSSPTLKHEKEKHQTETFLETQLENKDDEVN
ncbi:MAG: prolipoprotein diacylglyceryl transferase [Caldisericia bacterium]|nr:prolipoprotein diacylglyceryl transferase [Caldisericia bacterium]